MADIKETQLLGEKTAVLHSELITDEGSRSENTSLMTLIAGKTQAPREAESENPSSNVDKHLGRNKPEMMSNPENYSMRSFSS